MSLNRADFYDAELRRHNEHFRTALKVGSRDHVLDIGCGAGQSTREVARAATEGSVLGVDVSEELLGVARQRSADEDLRNVVFELGDAQVQALPAAHFDLCISRFGVMFFADPVAAFANIGRAVRPGGRLVLMVWQNRERNEWATAIPAALTLDGVKAANMPSAFSLGDREVSRSILSAAGFGSIDFAEVHEPVFYGSSLGAACEAIIGLFLKDDAPGAENKLTDEALQPLHALLNAHLTADGVLFDSRAWIVTANKTKEAPMLE